MSLFLLGKRIHIPVFEQNMMAKIAKKTIQFKFTIYTFVLTWFPHWVAGPWLLMLVPFPPNKELCTLSSASGAWRLGWGNSIQLCAQEWSQHTGGIILPSPGAVNPSFSMEHPGAGTNKTYFAPWSTSHLQSGWAILTQNSGTETYCNRWIWCSKGIFFVNPGYHDFFFVLLFLYLMGEAQ